jgi:poly-beta-1,6-N-acetyl-D-glucosamine N-deacetylase
MGMFRRISLLVVVALLLLAGVSPVAADGGVTILCYHDVGKVGNDFAISRDNLATQLSYLKQNGYNPISLQQYIDANNNKTPLPENPVLLTFDDGYVSFYTTVYPLIKQYQYPAVLAVVTNWETGQKPADVGQLVNWQQMKEMEQSGLVAIVSHSHDLHHQVIVNANGDSGEAGASLIFRDGKYESLESYKARVSRDLEENQKIFERELGHRVEAIVWPYGEYTLYGLDIAKRQGFKAGLGLGGRYNPVGNEKSVLEARRGLVYKNPDLQQFVQFVKNGGYDDPPMRAAWINTDQIYDPINPRQTDANVRLILDRYQRLGINTVFLQAYSDPKGDGNVDSVYFYTGAAPVKAAIFDHIARKFRGEGIYVYAVMPTLAAKWLMRDEIKEVATADALGPESYKRATPFSDTVRKSLRDLYTDLSTYSFLDGIVFQDDIYLTGSEDFSSAAKQAFNVKFGQSLTADILKNPQSATEWTNLKNDTLTDLTVDLMAVVRQFKPYAKFARIIHPETITDKSAQDRFAKSYAQFLSTYDYTLIMPGSFQDKQSPRPVPWVADLAATAMKPPGASNKLIFQVPTYDWDKKRWFLDNELKEYIKAIRAQGVQLLSFYPDAMFNEKSGLLSL